MTLTARTSGDACSTAQLRRHSSLLRSSVRVTVATSRVSGRARQARGAPWLACCCWLSMPTSLSLVCQALLSWTAAVVEEDGWTASVGLAGDDCRCR